MNLTIEQMNQVLTNLFIQVELAKSRDLTPEQVSKENDDLFNEESLRDAVDGLPSVYLRELLSVSKSETDRGLELYELVKVLITTDLHGLASGMKLDVEYAKALIEESIVVLKNRASMIQGLLQDGIEANVLTDSGSTNYS